MQSTSVKQFLEQLPPYIAPQIALIAAVLFESIKQVFIANSSDGSLFFLSFLQITLEAAPFFLAHYWTTNSKGLKAFSGWLVGFAFYPLAWNIATENHAGFAQWTLLSGEGWLLFTLASIGYFLAQYRVQEKRDEQRPIMSHLFSLNGALVALMLIWSILVAGMFNSTPDAVNNQPIDPRIDIALIFSQFGQFFYYWWQFTVIGLAALSMYAINRYLLIRRILAQLGVYAFVASAFIVIITATPMLANIVLLLPMNIESFTFIPSGDYNPYDPINFQVCFAFIAVSTPVILAFERQHQDRALAQIARQQIQTELKLLQQQINPHFLFNTLNNLYALTLTKSDDAPEMIMRLANLLRYTVYEGGKSEVSLSQELDYINDYLALQQIRSGDKCQITTEFPAHPEHWQLPPLMLISVLENAFKHGVEPSHEDCSVDISVRVDDNRLSFSCVNDIPESHEPSEPGIGLANLERRLELIFPDNYQLTAQKVDNKWTTNLELELKPCSKH